LEKIQAQYKALHYKHRVGHQFEFGDQAWLHISKERLKGEDNKLKPIRYGPFTILEKRGTNDFRLDLPSVDEFAPEYLDELQEDIILDRRTRTSCRGDVDYLRVDLKGTHPSKAKWIEKDKVRELFPHLQLIDESFWWSKNLSVGKA
jgi:hypothetical protein